MDPDGLRHKRLRSAVDGGPLTVVGIVHADDYSQAYPALDHSVVPARAVTYREMGAHGTFMTADVFDQLVDTMQTHVCNQVRRSLLFTVP